MLIAIFYIRFWWSWSYFGFTNACDTLAKSYHEYETQQITVKLLISCRVSLSLKMYIGPAKASDFCMLVCFAFMYDLLSCLCKSPEHLKTEFKSKRSKNGIESVTVTLLRKVRDIQSLENRCMDFKNFWREGWGKPYLWPSKKEFYSKN